MRTRCALSTLLVMTSVGAALVALTPPPARAEHALSPVLKQVLEPGVRIVVVEFYAHWCEACKKDAPKWNALRKRFGPQGLRIVGVNTREEDPSAACQKAFPLSADKTICDVANAAAETLGVTDSLPASFVWSWRGDLLAFNASFDEATLAIRHYLSTHPRLHLQAGDGSPPSKETMPLEVIKDLITQELVTDGRFAIVSDDGQRSEHARLRKKSHAPGSSDAHRCQLDAVVEANSVLDVRLVSAGGARHMLKLELSGAERSCVIASIMQPYDHENPARTARVAVANLFSQLQRPLERLGVLYAEGDGARRGQGSAATQEHPPADQGKGRGEVHVTSEPSGAVVEVDGQVVCNATPCSAHISLGTRDVTLKTAGYDTKSERVNVEQGTRLEWTLVSRVGTVTLEVTEAGLDVFVDGTRYATTPVAALRLEPGRHVIAVSGRCHERTEAAVQVARGSIQRLSLAPEPSQASLRLDVTTESGEVVIADISADGVALGRSSEPLSIPVCADIVRAVHRDHGAWEGAVSLRSGETTQYRATLTAAAGVGGDPEALYKQGLVSLATGDRAGAIKNFAAAAKQGRTETYGTLAQLYVLESRWVDCSHAVREYLLYHPTGRDARKVRGYLGQCQAGQR
jgi:thiol-disulfide isomerase/thioredoxin